MKQVKEFLRTKFARVCLVFCLVTSMLCVSAFAADTPAIDTAGITTAFTNGFNSMVTSSIAMVSAMVPIALTLCGVLFLVRKGMNWWNSMAK